LTISGYAVVVSGGYIRRISGYIRYPGYPEYPSWFSDTFFLEQKREKKIAALHLKHQQQHSTHRSEIEGSRGIEGEREKQQATGIHNNSN